MGLSESLAGLIWCSQAYLQWLSEGGKDQQLPGLNLTYAQLFFVNYAQVTSSPPPHTHSFGGPTLGYTQGHHELATACHTPKPEPVGLAGFQEKD